MAIRRVKVQNLDTAEYVENFREKEIRIAAGGSVVMTRGDANLFLSKMSAFDKATQKPRVKMLRMVPIDGTETQIHKCMNCGKEFDTAKELQEHEAVHKAEVFKDEDLEEGQDKKLIPCPLCDFEAQTVNGLKLHLSKSHKE